SWWSWSTRSRTSLSDELALGVPGESSGSAEPGNGTNTNEAVRPAVATTKARRIDMDTWRVRPFDKVDGLPLVSQAPRQASAPLRSPVPDSWRWFPVWPDADPKRKPRVTLPRSR